MADEAMVRTLAAQATAIWPQEASLFDRYALPTEARVLDVGCGTGELASRLQARYPGLQQVVGVDLELPHLHRALKAGRLERVVAGDAFHLPFPESTFHLGVCRHLLQAVPDPHRVVGELVRVVRPGGWIHVLAEDYLMIHFPPTAAKPDRFWLEGPIAFGRAIGTDMRVGRGLYRWLGQLGLQEIRVEYVVVDTLRVPREVFAAIWEAWRDGYAEVLARTTPLEPTYIDAVWEDMLRSLRDPDQYAVWHLPVWSARKPPVG